MGVWERRWFMVLNAWMRVLLRSPFHRLRSSRVVLLEFRGRRSGREYRMPVSYWQPSPDVVVCLTSATWSRWWLNLDGSEVGVWLRGRHRSGRSELITEEETRHSLVSGFLKHNAHDAPHYDVETDEQGQPLPAGLDALADSPDTKVIQIALAP